MKRHVAAFIVITVVAFLNLGLGSRADIARLPSRESCKTELGFIFDWCGSGAHSPCIAGMEEEYRDACQAGCVMYLCPEQITCTELDPMWCGTPCEDLNGATHWRNLNIALERCAHLEDDDDESTEYEFADFRAWQACLTAALKRQCPAHRTSYEILMEQEARDAASQGGAGSAE